MRDWADAIRQVAPDHLHLHPQVDQEDWVQEFFQYDAGWLHDVRSGNHSDLHAAAWNDLNYPARMGTLVSAGVPMIQRDSGDSIVATERIARSHNLGLTWREPEDLVASLRDPTLLSGLRKSVWSQHDLFTFDAHVDRLVHFLRTREGS